MRLSAADRKLERELLELVRNPRVSAEYAEEFRRSRWVALVNLRSLAFARMLRVWIRGTDASVAAEAAQHLAWMALDADRAHLLRVIRAGSWPMREAVGRGFELAAYHRHIGKDFARAAFEAIADVLHDTARLTARDAVEAAFDTLIRALLSLDPRRARGVLTGPDVLRADSRAIRMIVLNLDSDRERNPNAYRRPIDPGLLWPVYDALREKRLRLLHGISGDAEGNAAQAMGCILTFTADGDPDRTRRECRRILSGSERWEICYEARAALKRCRKVPEPDAVLRAFRRHPARYGAAATKVVRAYELTDHCLTDGLSLYFVNLGEHWRAAHAGLELAGADAAAGIVREAGKMIEVSGKLADARTRRAVMAAMDEKSARAIEKLADRFDGRIDSANRAIERYIAGHARDFPV